MTGQSQEMSLATSIAVINAAVPCGMFPADAMPQSDKDKITEAAKLVELALQAKVVADEMGHSNVPLWPGIAALLREAGALEAENGSYQAPEALPPPLAAVESQPQQITPPPTPPASAALVPPVVALVSAPPEMSTDPQANERWVDSNGAYWDVLRYSGGPQLEATNVATGEKTILPAGFLKSKATRQPQSITEPTESVAVLEGPEIVPVVPSAPIVQDAAPPSQEQTAIEWAKNLPDISFRNEPKQTVSFVPPKKEAEVVSEPPSMPEPTDVLPKEDDLPQQFYAPVDDHDGDTEYQKLLDQVHSDYAPTGMPVPMDLERPPSGIPEDLTRIPDVAARALHSQFNALGARARYLKGLEGAKARDCARARKKYLKPAMRAARKTLGPSATVREVTQLAEDDPAVATWIQREERHRDMADAYGDFLAMYLENVSVLSREWSMRQKEEDGS